MDSASGMLVIFFAVFVGAIASSFIIWLFVYRETGLFLFLLIISVMIHLILLCFSFSPFISVFFLTTYLCLHLNAIVALSHSLFHFFVCTLPPFLPPSLSLSTMFLIFSIFMSFPYFLTSAIVKLSQLGHSAVYCVGGIGLQFSWMAYLGPVTPVNCMSRPWLLGK